MYASYRQKEGETLMIAELYNKYFHDVFLYLKSLSKNDDIAEELTQETFFRAIKAIEKFKGDCDIRVWLCQIAKYTFYSYCRKNKRMTGEDIPETIPDHTVSIETSLEDADTAKEIHKILHEIKEPYKEVFTLRVFGELSYRQIAEIFGKSENWAAVTFHRAKLKIINRLEESE